VPLPLTPALSPRYWRLGRGCRCAGRGRSWPDDEQACGIARGCRVQRNAVLGQVEVEKAGVHGCRCHIMFSFGARIGIPASLQV